MLSTPLPTIEATDIPMRHANYVNGSGHKKRVNNPDKPFIAWDGEGYTDTEGVHHYNLFGNSEGSYVQGASLSYEQCFELLLSTAAQHDAIHVIFAGTYDLVMMIHSLPKAKCQRIMSGKPTWIGPYRVQFFRNKWLSLRDKGGRKVVLYDVFTFFACAFVKACRQYLGESEELDDIASVKLQRSTFNQSDLETKVIPYWKQELAYLVRLCEELRSRLASAGISMSRWHGPGAIASAVLTARKIKPHIGITPDVVTEVARHAYYGGRFEQFKLGHWEGKAYQYDINSAYPASIARLPSLANATWSLGDTETFEDFGLYQIRFASHERYFGCYPLPWRSGKGRIYYPRLIGAPSWYWGIEAKNLLLHPNEYEVLEAWIPTLSDERPFAFVKEMYGERQRMKAAGDPAQLAVKLALNSLYGKLAQSKGAVKKEGTWRLPAFHQLLWAGWITAATRAQLYAAIAMNPESVIAVETDAVFTTAPLDLPISNLLGEWSVQEYDALTFIQSGVYFALKGEDWVLKSRGFESHNQQHAKWLGVLARSPMRRDAIGFSVNRFGTVPGLSNWAKWYSYERETIFVPVTSKRVHVIGLCPTCKQHRTLAEGLHPLVVPQSQIASGNICSAPHGLPWADDTGYAWEGVFDEADIDTMEIRI